MYELITINVLTTFNLAINKIANYCSNVDLCVKLTI